MKKIVILLSLIALLFGCQREKGNEVGVSHNKSLIIPPTNDLPIPGSSTLETKKNETSPTLIDSILIQTEVSKADSTIIEKIDEKSGYKTDENFFQWLFKGKSKR